MLRKILLAVVVVAVAFVAFVSTRPARYRIERSARLEARPATVFALLDGYERFSEWSPWQKLDPQMTTTRQGPVHGAGATYRWSGNDKAGAGSMHILAVVAEQSIEQEIRFERPFASVAHQTYVLVDEAGRTRVTWSMDGDNSFFAKAMQLFVSMDDLIGKDLDDGLKNLAPLVAAEQRKLDDAAALKAAAAPVGDAPPPP